MSKNKQKQNVLKKQNSGRKSKMTFFGQILSWIFLLKKAYNQISSILNNDQ